MTNYEWENISPEAVHEAGHAVIAHAYNFPIIEVKITDEHLTRCDLSFFTNYYSEPPLIQAQLFKKIAIHKFAGRIAETIFKEEPSPKTYHDDYTSTHGIDNLIEGLTSLRLDQTQYNQLLDKRYATGNEPISTSDAFESFELECTNILKENACDIYQFASTLDKKKLLTGDELNLALSSINLKLN